MNYEDINEIDLTKITDSIFGATVDQEFEYSEEVGETVHEDSLEEEKEEEVEEPKNEIIEEQIAEEVTNVETEQSQTFKVVESLIKLGQIEDFEVEIEGKEPIKLSEFKDIDEDTLKSILDEVKNQDKDKDKEDTLSTKGLTETQKKLIGIIKNGNTEELQEVFKEGAIDEPWKGYDPTNLQHQRVAYNYYLMNQVGLGEEEARELVSIAEKNLTLDTKANLFVEKHKETYRKSLESKEAELKQKREEELKKAKEFQKELNSTLKEMELKPEKVLEIVKLATIKDSNNQTTVDKLFHEAMSDVEKAKDIILLLTEPEIFYNNVESKARFKEKVENAKRIKLSVKSKESSASGRSESAETESLKDALDDLFKI